MDIHRKDLSKRLWGASQVLPASAALEITSDCAQQVMQSDARSLVLILLQAQLQRVAHERIHVDTMGRLLLEEHCVEKWEMRWNARKGSAVSDACFDIYPQHRSVFWQCRTQIRAN